MNIYTIFFIFMITTSITLTGFVLRQKKNNRMLGELVAQSKVNNASKYSAIGVGMQNQEFVSKCPSCAEWIKLEAKICKACQSDVENHNQSIKEGMTNIDIETQIAMDARNQVNLERRQALFRNPLFRVSVGILLIVALFMIISNVLSSMRFNKATAEPESPYAVVQTWNSAIAECSFPANEVWNRPAVDDLGWVSLDFQLPTVLSEFDKDSERGKRLTCFSEKALGFNLFDKLDVNGVNNIVLPNGYSFFGASDKSYIAFYWD